MGVDVSRETRRRLDVFSETLQTWNSRINLISRGDVRALWTRHIADSAQLFALRANTAGHWVDLGTGGGFPGLIVSILAAEAAPELRVTLVESDQRKVAFLATAARVCGVAPRIICGRAETVRPLHADVLSARALAPLSVLLGFAERHLAPSGVALFPKGARCDAELTSALESWSFTGHKIPSRTDPTGVVLAMEGVRRA